MVFLLAVRPPELLVWINLFALAGQEALFFSPILFGLYWKKANSFGAISSMIAGVSAYLYITIMKTPIFGMHAVVPALGISVLAFITGSYFGKEPREEVLEIFFED